MKRFYYEGPQDLDRLNAWFRANNACDTVFARIMPVTEPYPELAELFKQPKTWDELQVWSGKGFGVGVHMSKADEPCVISLNERGFPEVIFANEALLDYMVAI